MGTMTPPWKGCVCKQEQEGDPVLNMGEQEDHQAGLLELRHSLGPHPVPPWKGKLTSEWNRLVSPLLSTPKESLSVDR